jgi:hypothetical protein
VIHEHDDLVLASAAIDFGLTEDEATRLRRAVADCPVCAERATAYRRQFRLLSELPVLEPSDALRRRVQAAAIAGRAPRTGGLSQLLLAAALVIGGMLALLAVIAGGAFKERPIAEFPPIDTAVSPSTPPAPVGSARPGTAPSAPVGPAPSDALAHLPKDAIADVISTNLRLRSEPRIATDSIKLEPFLDVGDRLLIISGPVTASDHDWYQVAAWRPSDPSASWPIGWVATADVNGDHWIAPGALSCPETPTTADLAALRSPEIVACYGNRTISLRAVVAGGDPVDPCPSNQTTICLTGPTWLAGSGGRVAAADALAARATDPPLLALALDPAGQVSAADLPPGRMIRLEGAFDHPAASSCSIAGAPTSVSVVTVTDAILRCRSRFVVTRAVPEPAFLTVQSAAVTTTSGLRVRSLGLVDEALSERYAPLLDVGTHLFVLDGPVLGSGYDWYRVVVPAVTRSDGQPMVGWIAVAGKNGEVWAKDVDLGCPPASAAVTVADLARLGSGATPDGGLACFGDAPISTAASVTLECHGPDASATGTTNWLGLPARMTARLGDGSTVFEARVHPDLAGRTVCGQPTAGGWTVDGHFSDSEAEACGTGASSDAAAALATYRCRTIFVVTGLTATAP